MTKVLFCLLVSSLSALMAQSVPNSVEVVPGVSADALGAASTDRLSEPLMFHEVFVNVPLPHGGRLNGRLVIAFASASRQFWWMLYNNRDAPIQFGEAQWFASHAVGFISAGQITVFWNNSPTDLFIVERRGLMASTMDEAQQKAIEEIRDRAATAKKGEDWLGFGGISVPLGFGRISGHFWIPPGQPNLVPGRTKILSVSREGKNWKLIMKNEWVQELILDESYGFISTRRLE